MFAISDIRELVHSFPTSLVLNHQSPYESEQILVNASDSGFVSFRAVEDRLDELLRSNLHNDVVSLSTAATKVNIAQPSLLDVIRHSQTIRLLNNNRTGLLNSRRTETVIRHLFQKADETEVSLDSVERSNDISLSSSDESYKVAAYNTLAKSLNLAGALRSNDRDVVHTDEFAARIQTTLQQLLKQAIRDGGRVILQTETFKGCSFATLSKLVSECYASKFSEEGTLSTGTDSISFESSSCIDQKHASSLEALVSGEVPYRDINTIAPPTESLRTLVGVTLLPESEPQWAVSTSWLESTSSESVGYLSSRGLYRLPQTWQDAPDNLRPLIFVQLLSKLAKNETVGATHFLHDSDHIYTDKFQQQLVHQAETAATTQAQVRWDAQASSPEEDAAIDFDGIFIDLSSSNNVDGPLIDAIVGEEGRQRVQKSYAQKHAELQAIADVEFTSFWAERWTRMGVYVAGLQAVGERDVKLRDQLSELLLAHVKKELIPEAISKARSRGLMRGRKVWRDAHKLQETVKSAKDMQDISQAVSRFSRLRDISSPSDQARLDHKGIHITELQKGAQKDKDNPRLFLTLVVVLAARHLDGVVYATGKFAPKLLKLIKGSVAPEVYTQVDGLKEKVKAGSVSPDDQAAMRRLAQEAE